MRSQPAIRRGLLVSPMRVRVVAAVDFGSSGAAAMALWVNSWTENGSPTINFVCSWSHPSFLIIRCAIRAIIVVSTGSVCPATGTVAGPQ